MVSNQKDTDVYGRKQTFLRESVKFLSGSSSQDRKKTTTWFCLGLFCLFWMRLTAGTGLRLRSFLLSLAYTLDCHGPSQWKSCVLYAGLPGPSKEMITLCSHAAHPVRGCRKLSLSVSHQCCWPWLSAHFLLIGHWFWRNRWPLIRTRHHLMIPLTLKLNNGFERQDFQS